MRLMGHVGINKTFALVDLNYNILTKIENKKSIDAKHQRLAPKYLTKDVYFISVLLH
jgi:hypothetical protein